MANTADTYAQALAGLLPTGFAWPRDNASTLMRVLAGMANNLAELDAVVDLATVEWQPQATTTRLAEWEAAVGLPDGCGLANANTSERRAAVLMRLRGLAGAYDDSSASAPAAIEAASQRHGLGAVVRYNTPLRCGRDRVLTRVGRLDGQLHVSIDAPMRTFRVAADRVASRLVTRPREAVALACYLIRQLPARFSPRFTYSEDVLPTQSVSLFRVLDDRVATRLKKRTFT